MAVASTSASAGSPLVSTVQSGADFAGILDCNVDALASLEVAVKLPGNTLKNVPYKEAWCCFVRQSHTSSAFVSYQDHEAWAA